MLEKRTSSLKTSSLKNITDVAKIVRRASSFSADNFFERAQMEETVQKLVKSPNRYLRRRSAGEPGCTLICARASEETYSVGQAR